jgi:hypothetical protein
MIVSSTTLLWVNLAPLNQTAFNTYSIAMIADLIGQVISEAFLCEIFWRLGTKVENSERARTNSLQVQPENADVQDAFDEASNLYEIVETVEYDEDAELQARIWNSLVRTKKDGFDDDFQVSAASMSCFRRTSMVSSHRDSSMVCRKNESLLSNPDASQVTADQSSNDSRTEARALN